MHVNYMWDGCLRMMFLAGNDVLLNNGKQGRVDWMVYSLRLIYACCSCHQTICIVTYIDALMYMYATRLSRCSTFGRRTHQADGYAKVGSNVIRTRQKPWQTKLT
jgi:hypothetical protein